MTNIMTSHPQIAFAKRVPLTNLNLSMDNNSRSKSLNRGVRQKELQRITNENENLLKRLQEKSSLYNVFHWEIERKKQE